MENFICIKLIISDHCTDNNNKEEFIISDLYNTWIVKILNNININNININMTSHTYQKAAFDHHVRTADWSKWNSPRWHELFPSAFPIATIWRRSCCLLRIPPNDCCDMIKATLIDSINQHVVAKLPYRGNAILYMQLVWHVTSRRMSAKFDSFIW